MTCDDFLAAMADANNEDLSGVARWYSQAGTPTLTVSTSYDAAKHTFTINTKQVTPPTNGQPDKVPVLIPLKVGRGELRAVFGGCMRLMRYRNVSVNHNSYYSALDCARRWHCSVCCAVTELAAAGLKQQLCGIFAGMCSSY